MKDTDSRIDTIDRDVAFLALCAPLTAGAAALAVLIGSLTLLGWIFDVDALLWVPSGMESMKANAALCFILAGVSLWVLGKESPGTPARILAGALGGLAALAGLLTVVEYLSGWNPALDQLLLRDLRDTAHETLPGRMAPNEALVFLLAGLSLLLLSIRRGAGAVSAMAFVAGMVALHGLMGFAYAPVRGQGFWDHTHIAFPTAMGMMALSAGILFALRDRGMMEPFSRRTAAAVQARRLLPSMIIVPFLLVWVRHEGFHRGLFQDEFGVALVVVSSSAALAVVVWIGLRATNRSDAAMSRAFETLKSEQRFRSAIEESILTGIVVADHRGRITYVNPEFCRMVGRGESELLGSGSPYPFTDSEERRSVFEVDAAVRQGLNPGEAFEFLFRRGDGERIVVSAFLSKLRDDRGQAIGTLGAVTDVTAKKRQEREMARTSEILGRIFSNMELGIVYMDRRFNIVRVNRAFSDAFGSPPDHIIGRNHFDLFPRGEMEAVFRGVVESGEPHSAFAEPYGIPGRPELGRRFRDWTLQPVKGRNGVVEGLILWMNDVTQRVQAESTLRDMEEAMLRQGKLAVLGQMAAGIAHEIRNPLSGLNLYLASAEKLSAEAEFRDPDHREALSRSLATARAASVKIEGVIRRVMDFARPAPSRLAPVVINEAVSEALEMAANTARKDGVSITADLSGDLPACRADARLIEQLVLNLVTNAMQASEKGAAERRVEVSTAAEGECVVLRVGDSGQGVSEEDRGRIFDPFFTTKATGTGLGLSISSRIVADHGGTIEVGSGRLGGAEFRVRLPAC